MPDEDAIVAAALEGSRPAVEALFDRHWLTAWRAAYAVTGRTDLADDAAQEAFVSAIRSLSRFERGRRFAPWIATIAVNRARDLLRAERRRKAMLLDETLAPSDAASSPPRGRQLLEAVAALPSDQREVVVLHHVLGFTLSEIAQILDTPQGTVASRLSRGVAGLRNALEAEHA